MYELEVRQNRPTASTHNAHTTYVIIITREMQGIVGQASDCVHTPSISGTRKF